MDASNSSLQAIIPSSDLDSDHQRHSTTYLRVCGAPISQGSPSVSSIPRSASPPLTDRAELEEPPFRSRKRRSTLSAWSWEILLLVFAVVLLVLVFVTLAQQDGKLSQGWNLPEELKSLNLALPEDLSLNTLVSLLSTFLRASMVAVAASIISQGKWAWYWDRTAPARPLRNLQHFEDASRGIWGSLRLIPIVMRHSPAVLVAALIIILSFAVGPFVQQCVRTEAQEVPVDGQMSSLPVTYSMNLTSDDYFRTLAGPMFSMFTLTSRVIGIIYSTLGNPSTQDSIIGANCPTGNCNFPRWGNETPSNSSQFVNAASVGVCSSCLDAAALTIQKTDPKYFGAPTAYLPNGMKIGKYDGAAAIAFNSGDSSWADQLYDRDRRASSRWAYVNATVLSYKLGERGDGFFEFHGDAVSMVCSLYPCLRAYSASVKNGTLDENLLQSTPLYPNVGNFSGNGREAEDYLDSSLSAFLELAAIQEPCRIGDTIDSGSSIPQLDGSDTITTVRLLDPSEAPDYPARDVPQQCLFRVEASSFGLLSSFITDQIFANSTCLWNVRQGSSVHCGERWWLDQFWEEGNATTDTIKTRFASIADSFTAQIRLGLWREPGSTDHVAGTILQTVSFTAVSWPWLILPTVMLLVEALVLLGMIVGAWRESKDEMVWKSNLLGFVFHRDRFVLEPGEKTDSATNGDKVLHGPLQTAKEMEQEAQQMKAKFARNGADRWSQHSDGRAWNNRLRRPTRIQDSDLDSLLMDEDMELRPLPQQTAVG